MKRSTRRRLTRGVLYAGFLVLVLIVAMVADWEAIRINYLDSEVAAEMWPEVVTVGIKNTLIYTAIAFTGGLTLAVALALMRLSTVTPYRWLAIFWIETFRGLPALVVILFAGFALPLAFPGFNPPGGTSGLGVVALMAVASAYLAETIRAGIQAVPKGQIEAARSLGMGPFSTLTFVTLPQAIRIVIPPLTNEFVLLLKDTSLLAVIGFAVGSREMTALARDTVSQQSNSTPYVVAALAYLVITVPLIQLVSYLERRQQRAR